MKINSLTPEQKARFGEWSKKWIDIGLSTEPADFDAATEAALKAYTLCNLEKPMVVLRCASPYAATIGGAYAWAILRELFKGDQVRDQVGAQVGAQVRDQVWDQVRAQVRDQVWDQVRAQVGAQVGDQVWAQVGYQVWDQVGAQVWAQVRDQVGAQVGAYGFGYATDGLNNDGTSNLYYAAFASWVSFFRDVCGWDGSTLKQFEISETLVKSCGWTWWHQNVLAISDRPSIINRDEAGRLHCETGPSIAYRDGWSLYHWHGVNIPKEWMTDKPSAKAAITWPNIEQRRAACEIVGWAKVLKELDAVVIDKDGDPEIGTLLEVELPDSGKERFIHVKCGTGREFALPVPRDCGDTALAANMWTYGLDANAAFIPEVRT